VEGLSRKIRNEESFLHSEEERKKKKESSKRVKRAIHEIPAFTWRKKATEIPNPGRNLKNGAVEGESKGLLVAEGKRRVYICRVWGRG